MERPEKKIFYKNKKYCLKNGYYMRTERLHQTIWEESFGKIPEGMVIHHKNGIGHDNRIENLECMTIHDHHALHFSSEKQLKHLHSQREKAAEAHRTPEARKRFSDQMKNMWKSKGFNKYQCTVCGVQYESRNKARPKYCSQKCRNSAGYKKYKQKVNCVICKKEFETSKGKRAAILCTRCRAMARWEKIRENKK
jgi:hypothetical protein